MRIIISPAKQMRQRESLDSVGAPVFLDETRQILEWMRSLSFDQAKSLWGCSEKLALDAYEMLQNTDIHDLASLSATTPAILAYDGIAFKYMAPNVFEFGQFDYVQDRLRILSGFYGALKPMDGIVPYRLEMQHKVQAGGCKDLYEFWGSRLYDEVMRGNEDRVVVNLASKEYSRCIERYLQPGDRMITCTFAQEIGGRLVQKGVWCKMARGEMVRYLATIDAQDPEAIKSFGSADWKYSEERSSRDELVFLHQSA